MDPFEVRLAFAKLISCWTVPKKTLAAATAFALKHAQKYKVDIYSVLTEEFREGDFEMKRYLFSLLSTILMVEKKHNTNDYAILLAQEFEPLLILAIAATDLKPNEMTRTKRNLIALRNEDIPLPKDKLDYYISKLQELCPNSVESPDEAKLTSNDILAKIESDREQSKKRREDFWRRSEDERPHAQLEEMWKYLLDITIEDKMYMQAAEAAFSNLNPEKRTNKRSKPAKVIIWMEDSAIYYKELVKSDDKTVRYAAKDFDEWVDRVARHWFYFEQLKKFRHGYIDELVDFDDHRDLSHYSFDKDALSKLSKESEKEKGLKKTKQYVRFYQRERAYRLRKIYERLSDKDFLKHRMNSDDFRHAEKAVRDIDRVNGEYHSIVRQFMKRLQNSGYACVYVGESSLCLLLSQYCLLHFNEYIDPFNVYCMKDLQWSQIVQVLDTRFSETTEYILLGASADHAAIAKMRGWTYYSVRKVSDVRKLIESLERDHSL